PGPADRHGRRAGPVDRAGRRRRAGGRPPRRGRGQTVGGSVKEEGSGEVPVSAAGRLLGVDYGDVRVGLAVSDPDRKIAFPLTTYERRGRDRDAEYFRALAKAEAAAGLVVGLPVHLSGVEGKKAAQARAFGAWLGAATGLPVAYWDERFSTADA